MRNLEGVYGRMFSRRFQGCFRGTYRFSKTFKRFLKEFEGIALQDVLWDFMWFQGVSGFQGCFRELSERCQGVPRRFRTISRYFQESSSSRGVSGGLGSLGA